MKASKKKVKRSLPKFRLWLFFVLHLTLVPYFKIRYRLRAKNRKVFREVKPPFLILPNHTTRFDPVMINAYVPHRIHYVMGDSNLRNPFMKWYYGLAGVIPKTKVIPDSYTVRDLMGLAKAGKVIGIFPEGRASWDGRTHEIIFSTVKLVRLLKLPVVAARIEGGFLSRPRWSDAVRRGGMTITYELALRPEEIKAMTEEEIGSRIMEKIGTDDYARPLKKYPTKNGAEYLEAMLYLCPSCGARQTLVSRGNEFRCGVCGLETRWTPGGRFTVSKDQPFETVRQWNDWQFGRLKEILDEDSGEVPLFEDPETGMHQSIRMSPLEPVALGTLKLYRDRFELATPDETYRFPLGQIDGVQVLKINQLEFYFEEKAWVFLFSSPRVSGFKYLNAVQHLRPEIAELF